MQLCVLRTRVSCHSVFFHDRYFLDDTSRLVLTAKEVLLETNQVLQIVDIHLLVV
jgi:hypothetical protein